MPVNSKPRFFFNILKAKLVEKIGNIVSWVTEARILKVKKFHFTIGAYEYIEVIEIVMRKHKA